MGLVLFHLSMQNRTNDYWGFSNLSLKILQTLKYNHFPRLSVPVAPATTEIWLCNLFLNLVTLSSTSRNFISLLSFNNLSAAERRGTNISSPPESLCMYLAFCLLSVPVCSWNINCRTLCQQTILDAKQNFCLSKKYNIEIHTFY